MAKWRGHASLWLLVIWTSFIAKLLLVIWCHVLLNTSWQSDVLMSLNSHWRLGNILSLSSNDRISSFNWIGGSKHCFCTSFSNLNCYFLFLVFSRTYYLLVSSSLSRLRGNLISHPLFLYLWYSKYHILLAPPYLWHTWHIFSKQDTRGNLAQGLVPVLFPCSAICWSSCKCLLGDHKSYLFFSCKIPRTGIFLRDISLR